MAQKTFQSLPLRRGQVGICILNLFEVGNIGEELCGVRKVFVNIVEISKDDVTPENEFVEWFSLGIECAVT